MKSRLCFVDVSNLLQQKLMFENLSVSRFPGILFVFWFAISQNYIISFGFLLTNTCYIYDVGNCSSVESFFLSLLPWTKTWRQPSSTHRNKCYICNDNNLLLP